MKTHMNLQADFDFWVKFEKWNIEQMTALALGYNPLYFDKYYVENLRNGLIETTLSDIDVEILLNEYDQMHALIIDSIKSGVLKVESTPKQVYKWMMLKDISVFQTFKNAIYNSKQFLTNLTTEPEINIKRKKQLYKMILSIAIMYKYNPENNKNPSTSKFRNAMELAGFNVDDNTIRDVVNRSYELHKDSLDHSVFEN